MRYRFVDEIVALDLGPTPRIEIAKTFGPEDDALSGPAGREEVPRSLVLELLAMAGGHLIVRHDGSRVPLLLKVRECRFEHAARAGVRLRAVAELVGISSVSGDATVAESRGEVYAGDTHVASGRLLYVCARVPGLKPVPSRAFLD